MIIEDQVVFAGTETGGTMKDGYFVSTFGGYLAYPGRYLIIPHCYRQPGQAKRSNSSRIMWGHHSPKDQMSSSSTLARTT